MKSIHIEPQTGGLPPTGVAMSNWLGRAVCTIAMTTCEGEDGWVPAQPVAPATPESLEGRFHALGKPHAFLDLRALEGSPRHPMRKPQRLRIDRYCEDPLADVSKAFAALLHIDRMARATPIRPQSP